MTLDLEERQVYAAALRLLSRREHSARELQQKLVRKLGRSASIEAIESVISQLQDDGLQSDVRYAEVVIRSRIARGYGPFYIEQSLRSKGIAAEIIQQSEDWQNADWLALAQELKIKKFPSVSAETRYEDPKSWQKAARTLQQKGYSAALIGRVLDG